MIWTILFVIGMVAIVLLVDLWLLMRDGWTISRTMRELGKHPIVPFICGLILGMAAGHFWWQIH